MRAVPKVLGGILLVVTACGDVAGQQQRPDAPVVDAPPPRCASSADCDDGLYCNGAETCDPTAANANALGCVAGTPPCDLFELCTETGTGTCAPRCDVTKDRDGDGYDAVICGGDDCNDDNAAVHPMGVEVCDLYNENEDCDATTFGGVPGQWNHCSACGSSCAAQQACESNACIAARRVFITSTTHTGNLGGVAGADTICQTRANEASLGGVWKAYLTTNGVSIATRISNAAVPYVRLDGVRVADSFADLSDGSVAAPVNITEKYTIANSNVWTGLSTSPLIGTANDCVGWTSATTGCLASGPCGNAGQSNEIEGNWDGFFVFHCDSGYRLYCIEQ